MKRISVSLTDEQYDLLWQEHVRSRKPVARILVEWAFEIRAKDWQAGEGVRIEWTAPDPASRGEE